MNEFIFVELLRMGEDGGGDEWVETRWRLVGADGTWDHNRDAEWSQWMQFRRCNPKVHRSNQTQSLINNVDL